MPLKHNAQIGHKICRVTRLPIKHVKDGASCAVLACSKPPFVPPRIGRCLDSIGCLGYQGVSTHMWVTQLKKRRLLVSAPGVPCARHKRELAGSAPLPAGRRLAGFRAPAQGPEAVQAADAAAARAHWAGLGWDAIELYSGTADAHADALLARARALAAWRAAQAAMAPSQRAAHGAPTFRSGPTLEPCTLARRRSGPCAQRAARGAPTFRSGQALKPYTLNPSWCHAVCLRLGDPGFPRWPLADGAQQRIVLRMLTVTGASRQVPGGRAEALAKTTLQCHCGTGRLPLVGRLGTTAIKHSQRFPSPCMRACSGDGLDALQHAYTGPPPPRRRREGGPSPPGASPLQESVDLLADCRADELAHLERAKGERKLVAMYRCGAWAPFQPCAAAAAAAATDGMQPSN